MQLDGCRLQRGVRYTRLADNKTEIQTAEPQLGRVQEFHSRCELDKSVASLASTSLPLDCDRAVLLGEAHAPELRKAYTPELCEPFDLLATLAVRAVLLARTRLCSEPHVVV